MAAALQGLARSKPGDSPAGFSGGQVPETESGASQFSELFARLGRGVLPANWRHQHDGFRSLSIDEEGAAAVEEQPKPDRSPGEDYKRCATEVNAHMVVT